MGCSPTHRSSPFFVICVGVGVAILAMGLPGVARAQDDDTRNFSAERFRLSSDQDGMLDVEGGSVIGHLNLDLGFWIGFADDPLAVYTLMDDGRERVEPFLTQRLGGALVVALGIGDRFQLGAQLPVILDQSYEFMDAAREPASSGGLGDVRVYPKLQLVGVGSDGWDISIIPVLTVPSAGANSYFGELSLGFEPELAVSRRFGAVGVGLNLGYRARRNVPESLALVVQDEVFSRAGVGYRFRNDSDKPIDVGLSISLATAAADLVGTFNRNHVEGLLGTNVRITPTLNLFAAGGVGLNAGFGTPDWRVLAGVRYARRVEPVDCDANPNHERCPVDCSLYPEDQRCQQYQWPPGDCDPDTPVGPPIRDPDCDGIETPPWLLPPNTKDDGKWPVREPDPPEPRPNLIVPPYPQPPPPAAYTRNPPAITRPPGGVYPPDTFELDYCPDQPGTPAFHGCPEPRVVVKDCPPPTNPPAVDLVVPVVEVTPGIGFVTGTGTVDLPSRVPLDELAKVLREQHPDCLLSIQVGGPSASEKLAQDRAEAVRNYLVDRGVDANNVAPVGFGTAAPATTPEDPAHYPIAFTRKCPGSSKAPCGDVKVAKNIGARFDHDSDTLRDSSIELLKRDVLWVLKAHPTVKVRVIGHTSTEGQARYNKQLSERRAKAVVAYLVDQGVAADRLTAIGYGEKYPLVDEKATGAELEKLRDQNRRIEFKITQSVGCPCKKLKVDPLYFVHNQAKLLEKSDPVLANIIAQLEERKFNDNRKLRLRIEGHTSTVGAAKYNKTLSQRRANAIRDYLARQARIPRNRMKATGFGEERPIHEDDGTDQSKQEANRRVEFFIDGEQCLPGQAAE